MPFCENCGNKVSENTKFCGSCGHKISNPNEEGNGTNVRSNNTITAAERKSKSESPIPAPSKNSLSPILIFAIVLVIIVGIAIIKNGFRNNSKIEPIVQKTTISNTFSTYYNQDRKFKIDYPDFLRLQPASENNDGMACTSNDGNISLNVSSSYYVEAPISSLYNQELKNTTSNITYKVQKNNWYVISGYTANKGKIFYEKVYLSKKYGEQLRTLYIEYSESNNNLISPLIPKIVESFTDL